MESPDAPLPARRIPRSVELASTALLPVQPPVAPAQGVKPTMLIAAAAVTVGLAAAAGWILFRDRPTASHHGPRDGVWRSPSAFESASLAATTSTWTSALRALHASSARLSGADTARVLHALLEAHRAGVALPPERQVELLIALDRLRTPHGWAAPVTEPAPEPAAPTPPIPPREPSTPPVMEQPPTAPPVPTAQPQPQTTEEPAPAPTPAPTPAATPEPAPVPAVVPLPSPAAPPPPDGNPHRKRRRHRP